MVVGIVVTHGKLGEALLNTAKAVCGDFSDCYAVSNNGLSPQALGEEVERIVDKDGKTQAIIFVDFFGGSCSHACIQIESTRPNTCVISGVNLPMLIAFLNKRDEVPFDRLPQEVIERSHNSIRVLDPGQL